MRLTGAIRRVCEEFDPGRLGPRCRYGLDPSVKTLLEVYDFLSERSMQDFFGKVRWRQRDPQQPSSWQALFDSARIRSRLARQVVCAVNFLSDNFQECFFLVVLEEVTSQIYLAEMRPDLQIEVLRDASRVT